MYNDIIEILSLVVKQRLSPVISLHLLICLCVNWDPVSWLLFWVDFPFKGSFQNVDGLLANYDCPVMEWEMANVPPCILLVVTECCLH